MRGAWGAVVAVALAFPALAAPPQDAHGMFVSHSYALTFTPPSGLFYCRLLDDWVGSDHGTILFLLPPRECDGAGFASMARGFEPPGVPRIEVYYGRTLGFHFAHKCRASGSTRFLGRRRPLCAGQWRGMVTRKVRGLYTADDETEAAFTLVTYPSRLRHDLPVFQTLTATVHPCSVPWQDAEGRTHIEGSGAPCPDGDFY